MPSIQNPEDDLDFSKKIISHIRENIQLKERLLDENLLKKIEECAQSFVAALNEKGKILFCGNGGSAADSQHLAAELVVR
jgi:D-sedoheptulose 7-phosphate isomerase